MLNLFRDIRFGIRALIKRPSFASISIITLALAIGANTAVFSAVNVLLLRALPFQNPDQLVSVSIPASAEGLPGLAAYEYLGWKRRSATFSDIAAYSQDNFNLIGQGDPERIACAEVTSSLFTTLGVQPLRGRWFLSDEDQPGRNQVVLVSEGFWQSHFGRDESLLGRSLTLEDRQYTVVGILPASFRFPGDFEIWMPLALDPVKETQGDRFRLVDVVGRLKSGASAEQARDELHSISKQTAAEVKEPLPTTNFEISPLHQQLVAGVRRTVLILWGAVALVMLLACANIANLMLSRTIGRQREMAVRAAVGASRWQLIRQLLAEALVLGLGGGALGILVAVWTTGAIAFLVPKGFTSSVYDIGAINLDWHVFVYSLVLSLITSVVFGLVPALSASRPNLTRGLREGNGVGLMSLGFRSMRGWLVIAEISLALVLLLAAALLTRSFKNLTSVDLGFDRENVMTARINLPQSKYSTPAQTVAFHKQLIERLSSLPGVQSVGTINHRPLSGFDIIAFSGIEGQPVPDRKTDKPLGIGFVSQDYFKTLHIPLITGRLYGSQDTADSQKVAIVNQAFVKKFFPNVDPLSKRVGFGCAEGLCRTLVGVVGNVRQEGITDDVTPEVYVPFEQMPFNGITLFVRTKSDPTAIASSLRKEVFAIDKNQPLYDVETLGHVVDESLTVSRSLMFLFSGLAGLALVLSLVGVYGVVSFSVSQRTREIGIRLALGARPSHVRTLILSTGLKLAITGVAIGLAAAFALTRFLSALLFGVTATDKFTFVLVALGLVSIAAIASLIPARRATRVDPIVALKCE